MYYVVLLLILFILVFIASMVISRSIKIPWLLINTLLYLTLGAVSYFMYKTSAGTVIIAVVCFILASGTLFRWFCCPNCDLFFKKVLISSKETDRWNTFKDVTEKYGNTTRVIKIPVTKVQITNTYECNHCGHIWEERTDHTL